MKNIFNSIWNTYYSRIDVLFNINELRTKILAIIIAIIVLSFILFCPLHRLSHNKSISTKKKLVESVDEIIYLLSKAQYKLSEEQTLKYDPCFALMKTMFDSWHFEYLNNLDTIKENVKKVELLLHQTVISDNKRTKLNKQKKALKWHNSWNKLFWYELNIVSFGLYNATR